MEVDDQLIETLKNADNISKIHSRALNYLAHNLRTEYEVREKLADLTEDTDAIDKVINILADQTLIDDQRYADSYVRTVARERKNGPDWIRRHLKDKRVIQTRFCQDGNQQNQRAADAPRISLWRY